jgi:TonB family protein
MMSQSHYVRTRAPRSKVLTSLALSAAIASSIVTTQAAVWNVAAPVNQVAPADPVAEFRKGALSPETPRLELPVPTRSRGASYSAEAMRAKISGTVELEIVVSPAGHVDRARIVKGLHPDLDQNAMVAVRLWEFQPGTLDGKTVPVWTEVIMSFRLR